ncbi:hypothetical protein PACTADRAFT_49035 [Pachysolen tannophilus NRRL Y-2460]|uniref:Uncharacterized protein n=1 Tax=Pachysolen tannophilus NRRL Y-2460 TaxID=669874 RepID=A0A1E4TZX0_PACTA|nr:hypothetical protein PACTADRAFT_49035 [Pachysolen tannophilus NRRL Y-2460]
MAVRLNSNGSSLLLSSEFYSSQLSDSQKQETEKYNTVDISIKDSEGEIVTIDLTDELPDPSEISTLLTNENCGIEIWLSIAKSYAVNNKIDEALEVIDNALKAPYIVDVPNFNKVGFNNLLIWIYLKKNDLASAIQESNNVNQIGISTVNLIARGILNLKNNNIEVAYENFDRILKKQPNNCYALLGKANVLFHRKNYSHALKLYQHVLTLNPLMKPDPRLGIGLCFWSLNNKNLAAKAWQNSLKVNPNNNLEAKILITLHKLDDTFINSNDDKEFDENYNESLTLLNSSLKESNSNPVLLLVLSSYYFSHEDYDTVEKLCTSIIKSDSQNLPNVLSEANFWLARCYFAKKDFINSTRIFHDAIKLNDANVLAKIGMVQSQIARRSFEEAIISLENLIKTNGKLAEPNYLMGLLYNHKKHNSKAIQFLEKYVNLATEEKEQIHVNAYLTLSELYESTDLNKSLEYLSKSIELFQAYPDQEIPLELFNNIGVFYYLKGNFESSIKFFETALEKVSPQNPELKVSVNYNRTRVLETSNITQAEEIYLTILDKVPLYLSAKLRLLLLSCLSKKDELPELYKEVEELLESNQDVMEVRSFYGWFIKKFGKTLQLDKDLESRHHKETLMKYSSHDSFALISLGNAYLSIAKEIRPNSRELEDKKNQYYVRATQLFQKVLSLDKKNLYAAQGLAITLAELKHYNLALEIFRKLKNDMTKNESTNHDISIYLNLGNLLIINRNYSKAIENYEQALKMTDSKDSKILSLIGRAWLLRGFQEKSHESFKKSLEYSEKAYILNKIPALKFNIAFVQFQIAEFIKKLPPQKRNLSMIEESLVGLEEAIKSLLELAQLPDAPYSSEELKSRVSMGSGTIKNQLERLLQEQKEYEVNFSNKLKEAKKLQEEERLKILKEQEESKEKERLATEQLVEQRKKLDQQAQEWLEQLRDNEKDENDILDDQAAPDDDAVATRKSTKKTTNNGSTSGTKKKLSKKRKIIVSDNEDSASSTAESDLEDDDNSAQNENNGEHKKASKNGGKQTNSTKKKKRKLVAASASPSKKSQLSNDFILDSDEELEDEKFEEDEEENTDK